MKSLFYLLLFLPWLFFSCDDDAAQSPPTTEVEFLAFGLDGLIVNQLHEADGYLYAATEAGIYRRNLQTSSAWTMNGLTGEHVVALQIISSQYWLASVSDPSGGQHALYETFTAGSNWESLDSNFGSSSPEQLNAFAWIDSEKRLLGTGNQVVAESLDSGKTWTPLYNDWQFIGTGLDVIDVHPTTGDYWSGGQNGIEEFVLIRSADKGLQWESWSNLLSPPSVVKEILFHPSNPDQVIVGAEHGIVRTTNNGSSWDIIKQDADARFYFYVDFAPDNTNRIYALSWVKNFTNPQPLILYVSDDGGMSWQNYVHQDNTLFGGVLDGVTLSENNETVIYAGLYKGGVYRITVNN